MLSLGTSLPVPPPARQAEAPAQTSWLPAARFGWVSQSGCLISVYLGSRHVEVIRARPTRPSPRIWISMGLTPRPRRFVPKRSVGSWPLHPGSCLPASYGCSDKRAQAGWFTLQSSGDQKSRTGLWAKVKMSPGLHSFRRLTGRICFLPFPASRGPHIPRLVALPPPSGPATTGQVLTWPSFWLSLSPAFRELGEAIRPAQ